MMTYLKQPVYSHIKTSLPSPQIVQYIYISKPGKKRQKDCETCSCYNMIKQRRDPLLSCGIPYIGG